MRTVLVVDDEPFVRISMASLRDWNAVGYDFRYEAGNGQQALDVLAAHPEVDVVLLDLAMPVMDGLAFLRSLPEAVGTSVPAVVVLSAHEDYPMVRKAFNLGVRDYLLKTEVDGETLKSILDRVSAELDRRGSAPLAEAQREFLVSQLLRDALTGEATAQELWQSLDVGLAFPLTVWGIWINDFETVAARYESAELTRFTELFLRSVRQLMEKWGGGRAVTVAKDVVAVFTGQGVDTDLFTQELKESVERYLSVRIEVRPQLVEAPEALPAVWDELGKTRSGSSRIVLMTKRYLREHHARPVITLDELAAHAEVSRNHLSYEFTRETGETITDYLAKLRVEDACRLLVGTTLKVYEISEKVGYPNVEHFCRVFKRITGISPNRWAGGGEAKIFRDLHQ